MNPLRRSSLFTLLEFLIWNQVLEDLKDRQQWIRRVLQWLPIC